MRQPVMQLSKHPSEPSQVSTMGKDEEVIPTPSQAVALWFVIQEIVKVALHKRISEKL